MSEDPPHRARSMNEMQKLIGQMLSPQEVADSIASFKPRPTDIIISPYGKCGTTWLQQSFHCLRTRGDLDFDDISRVVPWIETSGAFGIDLGAAQRAEPRGFKSHLPYDQVPKGARYVVSLRDPKDALVSMYRFMEGWFMEPGAVSFEDFAETRLATPREAGSYWYHLLTWWKQRDNPDVLLLSYEQMSAEPRAHIIRLAEFCGIELDEPLLHLTLELSSLDFMLNHKDKFDDLLMRELSEKQCNLPPGSDSAKVRKGGSRYSELPDSVNAQLDAIWTDVVAPETGFADYTALAATLRLPKGA